VTTFAAGTGFNPAQEWIPDRRWFGPGGKLKSDMAKQGSHTRLMNTTASIRGCSRSVIAELGGLESVRRLASRLAVQVPAGGDTAPSPDRLIPGKGTPRKLTGDKQREIWRLREKGRSLRQIALAAGVSMTSCQKVLKHPDAPPSPAKERRQDMLARALALRADGYTMTEVGQKLNVARTTVMRWVTEHENAKA
jgi:hypothetical protein